MDMIVAHVGLHRACVERGVEWLACMGMCEVASWGVACRFLFFQICLHAIVFNEWGMHMGMNNKYSCVRAASVAHACRRELNNCAAHPIMGYTLHYTCGKGDWKWRREWLEETRHYSKATKTANDISGQICRRCLAGTSDKPWLDFTNLQFHNQADMQEAARTSAFPNTCAIYVFSPKNVCCLTHVLASPRYRAGLRHLELVWLAPFHGVRGPAALLVAWHGEGRNRQLPTGARRTLPDLRSPANVGRQTAQPHP